MSVASIIFGLLLCGLSVFGMMGSMEKIATAFVPMMFGIPLVITGIISLNPHRSRVWMPVAAGIAACGFLVAVACVFYNFSEVVQGDKINVFALQLVFGLAGLLGIFLVVLAVCAYRNRTRRPRRYRMSPRQTRAPGPHPPVDVANPS